MSQHHFETTHKDGRPIAILAGWDRPLQGFFLVIEYRDVSDDDAYIYCNLSDVKLIRSFGMAGDFAYFVDVLKWFEIAVPERMIAQIQSDKVMNIGNAVTKWDAFGNQINALAAVA